MMTVKSVSPTDLIPKCRLKKQNLTEEFLQGNRAEKYLKEISKYLELNEVNKSYIHLCSLLLLPSRPNHHSNSKKPTNKFHKPWWNPELSVMRKQVKITLKDWLNEKTSAVQKNKYIDAQQTF